MKFSLVSLLVACGSITASASIAEDELRHLVVKVKGDDNRLMRWDTTEHTAEHQENGSCDKLPHALDVIMDATHSNTFRRLACEYATFCITDNPEQREIFSNKDGIHKAIVELAGSGASPSRFHDEDVAEEERDPEEEAAAAAASAVSSMASHLMYIASFANRKNQHTFFEEGAVPTLSQVIKGRDSTAVQIMWASAALQNLAASYCDTYEDGRCYWDWADDKEHISILDEEDTVLISDGTKIRQAILEDKELIETLKMLSCWGPVEDTSDLDDEEVQQEETVFIGENAIAGRDDNNPVIIPWAAMGALKNLALEPLAKPLIEEIMHCICYMSSSPDWLEENKGGALLYHMRRSDPCWFVEDTGDEDMEVDEEEEEEEEEEPIDEEETEEDEDEDEDVEDDEDQDPTHLILVCVDHNFVDAEGYHCDAYQDATDTECKENTDVFSGVAASSACCECGGGDPQKDFYDEE